MVLTKVKKQLLRQALYLPVFRFIGSNRTAV